MKLNRELVQILSPAYKCPEFEGARKEMRWSPEEGHIPRGFRGACGKISEVELVLVFAEPGDPFSDGPDPDPQSASDYSMQALRDERSLFHKNIRKILDMCWPETSFEEQMKKVWLTDSVLCSAHKECGRVPRQVEQACGDRYLLPQLKLFKNALIVAMGRKAERRLGRIVKDGGVEYAGAVAPPGCNTSKTRRSWTRIAKIVRNKQ